MPGAMRRPQVPIITNPPWRRPATCVDRPFHAAYTVLLAVVRRELGAHPPIPGVIGGRSLACGSEPQHVPAELRDARNTHQLHVALDLRPDVAELLLNARLSGCGERVEIH